MNLRIGSVDVIGRWFPGLPATLVLGLGLGVAPLVACSAFDAPTIVAGDATTVSLVSGWFIPEAVANSFCETHGKRAVYVSSAETSPGSDRRIHYFNCEDPIRE